MFIVHLQKFQIRLLKLFFLPLQQVNLNLIRLLVLLAWHMDDEFIIDQGISPEERKNITWLDNDIGQCTNKQNLNILHKAQVHISHYYSVSIWIEIQTSVSNNLSGTAR